MRSLREKVAEMIADRLDTSYDLALADDVIEAVEEAYRRELRLSESEEHA